MDIPLPKEDKNTQGNLATLSDLDSDCFEDDHPSLKQVTKPSPWKEVCNPYEIGRLERIARNKAKIAALEFGSLLQDLAPSKAGKVRQKNCNRLTLPARDTSWLQRRAKTESPTGRYCELSPINARMQQKRKSVGGDVDTKGQWLRALNKTKATSNKNWDTAYTSKICSFFAASNYPTVQGFREAKVSVTSGKFEERLMRHFGFEDRLDNGLELVQQALEDVIMGSTVKQYDHSVAAPNLKKTKVSSTAKELDMMAADNSLPPISSTENSDSKAKLDVILLGPKNERFNAPEKVEGTGEGGETYKLPANASGLAFQGDEPFLWWQISEVKNWCNKSSRAKQLRDDSEAALAKETKIHQRSGWDHPKEVSRALSNFVAHSRRRFGTEIAHAKSHKNLKGEKGIRKKLDSQSEDEHSELKEGHHHTSEITKASGCSTFPSLQTEPTIKPAPTFTVELLAMTDEGKSICVGRGSISEGDQDALIEGLQDLQDPSCENPSGKLTKELTVEIKVLDRMTASEAKSHFGSGVMHWPEADRTCDTLEFFASQTHEWPLYYLNGIGQDQVDQALQTPDKENNNGLSHPSIEGTIIDDHDHEDTEQEESASSPPPQCKTKKKTGRSKPSNTAKSNLAAKSVAEGRTLRSKAKQDQSQEPSHDSQNVSETTKIIKPTPVKKNPRSGILSLKGIKSLIG